MSVEVSGLASSQAAAAQVQAQQPVKSNLEIKQSSEVRAAAADTADEMVGKLQAAVEKLNHLMQNGQRSLNFSVDSSTERVVVRVVDTNTNEVIRQIPNEEALRFAEYIEGMVGLIFENRV